MSDLSCIKCETGDASTDKDYGELCTACREAEAERRAEAAEERRISDYYGSDTPQTVQEQYDAAARERREHDRR